jgi:outer membrane protein assembly factor BamC
METDWAENRAKLPQDMLRGALGRLLDQLYSTGERDKFRTRLERTADGGTEIYISHRGLEEVLKSGGGGTRDSTPVWQPRASDPDLEAEFLRRLMVRFGIEETRAREQVAKAPSVERARLVKSQDGTGVIDIDEPFDRAWRRVGLALDRVGFTVEDRDRSKGYYFVRYVSPEAEVAAGRKDEGMLSRLAFWRSSTPDVKPEQYRVLVKNASSEATQVSVQDKNGGLDKSATAGRILSLLHTQLK